MTIYNINGYQCGASLYKAWIGWTIVSGKKKLNYDKLFTQLEIFFYASKLRHLNFSGACDPRFLLCKKS